METISWNWGRRASWLLYALVGFGLAVLLVAIATPNLLRSRMAVPAASQYSYAYNASNGPRDQAGLSRSGFAAKMAEPNSAPATFNSLDRKVIRNGSLDLVVDTPSTTIEQIAGIAHRYNGYVVSSELTGRRENQRGCITIRVPAAQFDAAREEMKKLAKQVETEHTSADDVTMQYAENEATLRNYRAEEASYLEIMKRSGSIKDTLTVAQQLSDVRGRIERLDAAIRTMSVQTEMTALTVNVSAEPIAVPPQRWRPLYELEAAWKDGIDALTTYATDMMAILMYLPAVLAWAFTLVFGAKLTWMLFQFGARLFRTKTSAAA